MCGIVAMFSKGRPVDTETLARGTQALFHRGPDGQKQWVAPHGRVGLGHARLSIVDLAGGDQPLSNEEGTIHLVANGEIYDYQRIQRELESRGHVLKTRSDSEIILHLYEEEGTACLRHLRGEFAFVLWDERNGLLFAARDRFGIKPLYYAQHGDTLSFASEAKALFAMGVPARWDNESVFQHLHAILDQDRSMFEGVKQVPPGHFLLASRGHTQIQRYWDLDYPTLDSPPPVKTEAEYVERMREELTRAIDLRLIADVPVGCYLSGGIDSSAILGIASKLRKQPLEAFTIAFEAGEYDESPIAEEMAKHAGANFHAFRMPEDLLAKHYADAVAHSEILALNANCVGKYLLSKQVRDFGYKVVLPGEGADEILAGYPIFRRDFIANDASRDAATKAQQVDEIAQRNKKFGGLGGALGATLSLEGVRKVLGFVPTNFGSFAERGSRARSVLSDGFRAEYGQRDPYTTLLDRLDIAGQVDGRSPVHKSMYIWTKTIFPAISLNYLGDRMEMAHSIEGRTPFLDHHLVEAVVQMPIEMKIRGTTEKYALREAAKSVMAKAVYEREKHPFVAPIDLKSDMSVLVQDTLRGGTMDSLSFFNRGAVRDLLDTLPSVDEASRSRIFPVLMQMTSACILHERYKM